MSTTYTVKCRRCSGTGVYGNTGVCFGCDGTGRLTCTRYTPAEKAAISARRLRTTRALEQIKARAQELAGKNSRFEWDVRYGFTALRDSEPERFTKMLDSLDAGRLDHVIDALAAYHRNPQKGSPA